MKRYFGEKDFLEFEIKNKVFSGKNLLFIGSTNSAEIIKMIYGSLGAKLIVSGSDKNSKLNIKYYKNSVEDEQECSSMFKNIIKRYKKLDYVFFCVPEKECYDNCLNDETVKAIKMFNNAFKNSEETEAFFVTLYTNKDKRNVFYNSVLSYINGFTESAALNSAGTLNFMIPENNILTEDSAFVLMNIINEKEKYTGKNIDPLNYISVFSPNENEEDILKYIDAQNSVSKIKERTDIIENDVQIILREINGLPFFIRKKVINAIEKKYGKNYTKIAEEIDLFQNRICKTEKNSIFDNSEKINSDFEKLKINIYYFYEELIKALKNIKNDKNDETAEHLEESKRKITNC